MAVYTGKMEAWLDITVIGQDLYNEISR